MPNIIDILARALSLRQETALNSITPNRAGGIMYDTLLVLNQMQLETGSLLISKVYASVSAMEADTTPTSDLTGRALKPGQLVVIVTSDASSSDMGSEYRYNGPGSWTYIGKVGGLPLDTVPTQSSTKGITSGGVYAALSAMKAEGYKYMGIASPGSGGTTPGTPNQPVFYIAGPGSYPNFGSITVASGYIGFIKYSSGSWTVESVAVGGNYDEQISQLEAEVEALDTEITLTSGIEWTDNLYIRYDNGAISTASESSVTNHVDVSRAAGKTLNYSRFCTPSHVILSGMAFYDAGKVYISGVRAKSDAEEYDMELSTVSVPQNAKYARFTCVKTMKGSFELFFEQGIKDRVSEVELKVIQNESAIAGLSGSEIIEAILSESFQYSNIVSGNDGVTSTNILWPDGATGVMAVTYTNGLPSRVTYSHTLDGVTRNFEQVITYANGDVVSNAINEI